MKSTPNLLLLFHEVARELIPGKGDYGKHCNWVTIIHGSPYKKKSPFYLGQQCVQPITLCWIITFLDSFAFEKTSVAHNPANEISWQSA